MPHKAGPDPHECPTARDRAPAPWSRQITTDACNPPLSQGTHRYQHPRAAPPGPPGEQRRQGCTSTAPPAPRTRHTTARTPWLACRHLREGEQTPLPWWRGWPPGGRRSSRTALGPGRAGSLLLSPCLRTACQRWSGGQQPWRLVGAGREGRRRGEMLGGSDQGLPCCAEQFPVRYNFDCHRLRQTCPPSVICMAPKLPEGELQSPPPDCLMLCCCKAFRTG